MQVAKLLDKTAFWGLLAILLALAGHAPADAAEPARGAAVNDRTVARAIDRAVSFLYASANRHGIWDDLPPPQIKLAEAGAGYAPNWGGRTALVLNALAAAGRQRDVHFKNALEWVMQQQLVGTYALGLRLQLIHNLRDPEQHRPVLVRDANLLQKGARAAQYGVMWQYVPPPGRYGYGPKHEIPSPGDFSNVNYAVLGLWAASDEQIELSGRLWQALEASYVSGQYPDGGWGYLPRPYSRFSRSYGSMTTAGIASLYLILDHYYARRGRMGAFRKSPAYQAIQKGQAWMAEHFSPSENPGLKRWATYYFYNCERVAAAAGLKYFGKHDWFREIAAGVLSKQGADGAFRFGQGGHNRVVIDTAFCLLFLGRGSAPIVFNKLRHGGDWDNHVRELAALTGWLARQSERPANWQVVNLDAPAEDLTDSRMLYIAGTRPLKFSDAQREKLKRFVALGGLLVFHPDSLGGGFAGSVQKLLRQIWPGLKLTGVDLDSHPLGDIFLALKDRRVRLEQLASPVRLLALVVHGCPARAWERRLYSSRKDAFGLGANIHFFANDRATLSEMPSKLTYFAEPFRAPAGRTTRTVTLARIRYGDDPHRWDPEPLAFERFARRLAAEEKVNCRIKVVTPEELPASGAAVAHLTGVDALELTEQQWDAMDAWLKRGGTLLADQAGGPRSGGEDTFDATFRTAVARRYGQDALRPVLSQHPLLRGLGKLPYRHLLGKRRSSIHPSLLGIHLGDRPAILYSRYDLTCGLLGCPNPLVVGAEEEAAYKIVSRVVLSAAGK